MTRSSRRDWSSTLADIRRFNAVCRGGGGAALPAFSQLSSRLFCLTVGDPQRGCLHDEFSQRHGHGTVAGGHAPGDKTIVLTNGFYLQFVVALYLSDGSDGHLRASLSKFQYQADEAGKDWVFRYDYERDPRGVRPSVAHLHVRGAFECRDLECDREMKKVHFPTGRPTVESTIALLIEQFEVPSNSPEEIWRPALDDSQRQFLEVAHRPLTATLPKQDSTAKGTGPSRPRSIGHVCSVFSSGSETPVLSLLGTSSPCTWRVGGCGKLISRPRQA